MTPAGFTSTEHLEEVMTKPPAALAADLANVPGDIMVLGVGGKMGPTLARMAKRAAPGTRVVGVARFSEPGLRARLEAQGIECIAADLLSRDALAGLPQAPNIIFMAGRKFGSAGSPWLTWVMNAHVPALVAEHFARSRLVVFSTACVYPFVDVRGSGALEDLAPTPPGEYANSCAAASACSSISRTSWHAGPPDPPLYAIDMRYGVLHDLARKIAAGEPIDLTMGYANIIWQGDANEQALRALAHCTTPTTPLNLSGPKVSIRAAALGLGERLGVAPRLTGHEAQTAWLIDSSAAQALFGPPAVGLDTMLDWTAEWTRRGMASLNKPTHYETRDGHY